MPLPPVSEPFDYLITQIETDLNKAVRLCRYIRDHRRVGHEHRNLDALERSLEDRPGFIRAEHSTIRNIEGADLDGGDGIVRSDFTSYVREVEEINSRLESIAHPHHHEHHRSLFCHPHHHREYPHFHELQQKWENVRDGIAHTFSQFRNRLDLEAKRKRKEQEDKDRIDEDKKKAKEKAKDKLTKEKEKAKKDKEEAEEELKKEKEKAKKKADELKQKLEERAKADAARLAAKENIEQTKLAHIEEIARARDNQAERLLEKKIQEDPIDQVSRTMRVLNDLQQTVTLPRPEQNPVDQLQSTIRALGDYQRSVVPPSQPPPHENPIEQFCQMADVFKSITHRHSHENISSTSGGRAVSLDSRPIVICPGHHEDHERRPEVVYIESSHPRRRAHPAYYSPQSSFTSSTQPSHTPEVIVNNVIESIPAGDDEEIDINGGHVTTWTHPSHQQRRHVGFDSTRKARTVPPRMFDSPPLRRRPFEWDDYPFDYY